MKKSFIINLIEKFEKLNEKNYKDPMISDMINYVIISLRSLLGNWEEVKK